MPDRTKLKQSIQPARWVVRLTVGLIWLSTILVVGSSGVVFQKMYRGYRLEMGEGRNALAAAPYRAPLQESREGERRVAVIIDDLGIDLGMARAFCSLEMPVTLAVLPYQKYSQEVAREGTRRGKEVLLHLPLQPREYPSVNPGTGSLLLSMNREGVQAGLAAALDSLPGCVGVSSHMGSLFTEQEEPMGWLLSVVKERDLLFVDSLTTPHSVGYRVAGQLGIPFAQRTHFLDLEKTEESIIRQLCRLVDTAVREGGAIGIAHPSEETLSALPKVVAAFGEKGVRVVPVSQMVSSCQGSGVVDQGGRVRPPGQRPGR